MTPRHGAAARGALQEVRTQTISNNDNTTQ